MTFWRVKVNEYKPLTSYPMHNARKLTRLVNS